ncbi:GNAT family N-acetyltransferase [uncultured Phascolarctobacterium sp.]|uniref:GNAT family N-acetyltransferase n=1 Tax=uncultured Phascolarctobacterium sp. TaxID=512296 RepID=UPI00260EC9B3|nr:GNAT family N-acetyltransferase [uncultured Phascolarctobacterium sp.]
MQEQIRFATPADSAGILEIYAPYILETTISFEYEPPGLAEFTARIQKISSKYPYLVYERNGKILGFAYGSAYQERMAYLYDADLSIYLAPEAQNSGIGRKLYHCLLYLLQKQGFYNVYACITAENQRSIDFHKALGFRDLGPHPKAGYKFNRWLDIVWMDKQLSQPAGNPQPLKPVTALTNDDILKVF